MLAMNTGFSFEPRNELAQNSFSDEIIERVLGALVALMSFFR